MQQKLKIALLSPLSTVTVVNFIQYHPKMDINISQNLTINNVHAFLHGQKWTKITQIQMCLQSCKICNMVVGSGNTAIVDTLKGFGLC